MSVGYTQRGLPYPNPDDPVRDGAQRIKELAQTVDSWLLAARPWAWSGNLTTDANGAAQLSLPGNILGVVVMYSGQYGPIHIDSYVISGTVVGLFPRRPDWSVIPNGGLGATAVGMYSA